MSLTRQRLNFCREVTTLLSVRCLQVVGGQTRVTILVQDLNGERRAIRTNSRINVSLGLEGVLLRNDGRLVRRSYLRGRSFLVNARGLLLMFLRFLNGVSLDLHRHLLTSPLLERLILRNITRFRVVARCVVVSCLRATSTHLLSLPLLGLRGVVLTVATGKARVIRFYVVTVNCRVALISGLE